jgi:PPP family 3-phenylpropionic acid transporter
MATDKALGVSPEWRASLFHFFVFGSTGVASAYFAIWLSQRGISPDEIGVINAAPVIGMLLVNVLIGRLADKASDWRYMIIILSMIAAAASIGLFFVSGFWGIVLIWVLAVVPAQGLVPVIDAATLRMTQRRGTSFGVVRAWGTVGYAATAALAGPILGYLGEAAFLPLFVGFALLRALVSLQLPHFRAPPHEEAHKPKSSARLRDVLKPWFVLPLVGLGIVYSTNGVLSIFAGLFWSQQGIGEGWVGPLIAVGAAAEAAMMFFWSRLNLKVSARHLIIFSCLVAAVRWGAMALSPPVWVLFFLQLLHSITFAVSYFGGIYFIANWTSEDIAAEAQGFSYVLQQGMTVVALLGFGWFAANFGVGAWVALAAFALFGALLVFVSLRLKSPDSKPAHA